MSKSDDLVHGIEYKWRVHHSIGVQFAQITDFRDAALIELEVVEFQAQRYHFQEIIDYRDRKVLVIAIQRA